MHVKRTTRTWLNLLALTALVMALAAMPAQADVFNGDFENGGADWTFNGPADWSSAFPPAGGNPGGYAVIASPLIGAGGIGCLTQTFICGEPDDGTECTISFDYWLAPENIFDPDSGRIKVFVDGAEVVSLEGEAGWETVTFVVPCGVHVIDLCLEVDPADNGWRCCFDNVTATCTGAVAVDHDTWTNLKGLFR